MGGMFYCFRFNRRFLADFVLVVFHHIEGSCWYECLVVGIMRDGGVNEILTSDFFIICYDALGGGGLEIEVCWLVGGLGGGDHDHFALVWFEPKMHCNAPPS